MKNAVILHGRALQAHYSSDAYPSESNKHWLPWLQKQLQLHGVLAQTPELPNPTQPDWREWKREFERFDITLETILVGHSYGAGFIVRWLSEHPDVRVGKVALVAPYVDIDQEETTDFFHFELDTHIASRCEKLILISSTNDAPEIQSSVTELTDKLNNLEHIELKDRGHFTTSDSEEDNVFPELLDSLIA